MSAFPAAYLSRHGGTPWTVSSRHTSLTNLPLTAEGELEAVELGKRLGHLSALLPAHSPGR